MAELLFADADCGPAVYILVCLLSEDTRDVVPSSGDSLFSAENKYVKAITEGINRNLDEKGECGCHRNQGTSVFRQTFNAVKGRRNLLDVVNS